MNLKRFMKKYGLVKLNGLEMEGIFLDIRYATSNNFTSQVIYSDNICLLRREVLEDLKKSLECFKDLGYGILIWDAFRSPQAQQKLFNIYPDPSFVADPRVGSNHTRGSTIDLTLVKIDSDGKSYTKVNMPTEYDDFTERAASNYSGIGEEERVNREILHEVMIDNNFIPLDSEWWHFTHSKEYPLITED